MLSESKNEVWVHLYGGEQDGYRRKIELKTKAPEKFYICHVSDMALIDQAKGKQAKMVLQNKLATMCYEQFDDVVGEDGIAEYRYRRLESCDKALPKPAV